MADASVRTRALTETGSMSRTFISWSSLVLSVRRSPSRPTMVARTRAAVCANAGVASAAAAAARMATVARRVNWIGGIARTPDVAFRTDHAGPSKGSGTATRTRRIDRARLGDA